MRHLLIVSDNEEEALNRANHCDGIDHRKLKLVKLNEDNLREYGIQKKDGDIVSCCTLQEFDWGIDAERMMIFVDFWDNYVLEGDPEKFFESDLHPDYIKNKYKDISNFIRCWCHRNIADYIVTPHGTWNLTCPESMEEIRQRCEYYHRFMDRYERNKHVFKYMLIDPDESTGIFGEI